MIIVIIYYVVHELAKQVLGPVGRVGVRHDEGELVSLALALALARLVGHRRRGYMSQRRGHLREREIEAETETKMDAAQSYSVNAIYVSIHFV
mgnify:CR=1 FL=1